jgi:hypothetical protein
MYADYIIWSTQTDTYKEARVDGNSDLELSIELELVTALCADNIRRQDLEWRDKLLRATRMLPSQQTVDSIDS